MTESNLKNKLYSEFHQINRNLTYATIGLVALAAILVWIFGIDLGGRRTSMMGAVFIMLAVFTYKIPYISYRYMLKKYKNDSEKCSAIGYDWKQFHDLAMQRR